MVTRVAKDRQELPHIGATMGADLIGYLWVQPTTINPRKARAIIRKQVDACRRELKRAATKLNKASMTTGAVGDAVANARSKFPLLAEIADSEGNTLDLDLIEVWTGRLAAPGLINDLVSFLTGLGARDVAWRIDPDNPKLRICFAGEMSWGDTPSGFGYSSMQTIYALGLNVPLGIR